MMNWNSIRRFTDSRVFVLAVIIYGGILGLLASIHELSLRLSVAIAFAVATPLFISCLATLLLDEATSPRLVWIALLIQYAVYSVYYFWLASMHTTVAFVLTSLIMLLVVPSVILTLVRAWVTFHRRQWRDKIVILVADFANYGDAGHEESTLVDKSITQRIIEELSLGIKDEATLKIFPLCRPITPQHGKTDFERATEIGYAWANRMKPTIVVWGWYSRDQAEIVITPHFKILWPPRQRAEIVELQPLRAKSNVFGVFEPRMFDLQMVLSRHVAYLVTFTMGLVYLSDRHYTRAISSFRCALECAPEGELAVSAAQVHLAIAQSLYLLGRFEREKEAEGVRTADTMEEVEMATEVSRGRYIEAERECRLAMDLSQGRLETPHWGLGYILHELNRFEEAAEQWSAVLEKHPTAIEALLNRGRAQELLGRFDSAVCDYRAALSVDPNGWYPYWCLGRALFMRGLDLDEAIEKLEKSIMLKGDVPQVFNTLGGAYARQGEFEKAITTFKCGLKYASQQRNAQAADVIGLNLTHVYGVSGDVGHWIAGLKDYYSQVAPLVDPVITWHNEISFRLAEGRKADAALALQELLLLEPGNLRARARLGQVLLEQGDFDQAEREFKQVLQHDPNSFEAWFGTGWICKNSDRPEEAVRAYQHALEIEPSSVATLNNLANALMLQRDYEGAISTLRKAIELAPNDARPYVNLGNAYDGMGNLKAAIQAYRQAMALDNSLAQPHFELGVAYSNHGRMREAVVEFELAIALEPSDMAAYSRLADVYLALGDHNGALAILQRQLEHTQDFCLRSTIERKIRSLRSQT